MAALSVGAIRYKRAAVQKPGESYMPIALRPGCNPLGPVTTAVILTLALPVASQPPAKPAPGAQQAEPASTPEAPAPAEGSPEQESIAPAPSAQEPQAPPASPVAPAEPLAPPATQAPPTVTRQASPPVLSAPAAETQPEGPAPEGDPLSMDERPVDTVTFIPGKGFALKTADNDFSLHIRLRAQFLLQYLSREGEDRQALEVRRARLQLAGNMWGERTKYKVELAFSPRDVGQQQVDVVGMPDAAITDSGDAAELATEDDVVRTSPLLDWYVDFGQLRDLSLRVGQFKVPFSRQRIVSSADMQFVDRALTNSEFNLDRDIGLDLFSNDLAGLGMLRYHAGIFIGEGRNASDRSVGAGDKGYLYNVRLEALPLGDFDDYEESDHARSPEPRLAIGVGYALLQSDATSPYAQDALGETLGGSETLAVVDFNAHNLTADAVFKLAGFSAQTAFHLRSVGGIEGVSGNEGIGWMLAAGYLFAPTPIEIAGQYAILRGREGSNMSDEDELGAALNYYFAQHPLKLQLDFAHLWDDAGFGEGEDRVRLQLQASL
jgi:hypothetical protein